MARASTCRGTPAWSWMTTNTGSCGSAAAPASANALMTLVARPHETFRMVPPCPRSAGLGNQQGALAGYPPSRQRQQTVQGLARRIRIDELAAGGLTDGIPGLDARGDAAFGFRKGHQAVGRLVHRPIHGRRETREV